MDPDIFIEEDSPPPKSTLFSEQHIEKTVFALQGVFDLMKHHHTGQIAKTARKTIGGPAAPASVSEAYDIASNLKFDPTISGVTQPFARIFGTGAQKMVSSLARKTKTGVCYDASLIMEKALRKHCPEKTTIHSRGYVSYKNEDGEDKREGHSVVVSGTPEDGYTYYDTINKYRAPGLFQGKSEKEVRKLLQQDGFSYAPGVKFKGSDRW